MHYSVCCSFIKLSSVKHFWAWLFFFIGTFNFLDSTIQAREIQRPDNVFCKSRGQSKAEKDRSECGGLGSSKSQRTNWVYSMIISTMENKMSTQYKEYLSILNIISQNTVMVRHSYILWLTSLSTWLHST